MTTPVVSAGAATAPPDDSTKQYQFGRTFSLIVYKTDLTGLDLSQMRCKFSVKRSDTMTPNIADIRVYNLDEQTAVRIRSEFKRVILQAGYESNYGVIFKGNIKQVIVGRESATDTFIDIIAGDGDRAYNFAIVNASIAAGSTPQDHMKAAVTAMTNKDPNVIQGVMGGPLPTQKLARGKVLYGPAKNILRKVAQNSDQSWSIQDEKVVFVPRRTYLKSERVVLTSKTGMIGTPNQTNEGVNVKCLLNPSIRIGGRIQIDNKSIERMKINLSVPLSPANIPAPLTADGVYYVLNAEHSGDTRGVEWYTTLTTLNIDVSSNPINSVQVNYGE